jgi:hypothetical protein
VGYAVAVGLFIVGAFLFIAKALHDASHWHELHEQLDEVIYNLARAEQGAGQAEQEGG